MLNYIDLQDTINLLGRMRGTEKLVTKYQKIKDSFDAMYQESHRNEYHFPFEQKITIASK